MYDLTGRTIVLGVTGGIAAFKAATIASLLVQAGSRVDVVMTEAARRFVQPLTYSAITHTPVHTDPFVPWSDDYAGHIGLAKKADLVIVAPATAVSIARLALGLADDLIGLIALSTQAPLIVAPAMEDSMFNHPATREHLTTLSARGVTVVGPDRGRLASGLIGEGRLATPESIVDVAASLLHRSTQLHGKKVVVTAGGTQEPLDPVRFIGNRSSGTMGFALAAAATAASASVSLISGPTSLRPPPNVELIPVNTAVEMFREVELATLDAHVLIMAAAVADFRPEVKSEQKLKKKSGQEFMDIRLVRNPDILGSIDRPNLLKIGFAAETEDLIENATRKLETKRLDIIVANDAEATIGADESMATILTSDGRIMPLRRMSKANLATEIIDIATAMLDHENRVSR
ncbi:MAG TPA: bifunctional phosphopantothenoylcysteine decarboxylase/phosphopantothenate--cysteine ligase CoaBC [Thermomicrobiales bacterium]|nr:bifunctional phosphopantothenoylcysteine decarboxylase/phosphopantothenate--cysteine ligase CoaBC [Thermomicrobiales bacterium]